MAKCPKTNQMNGSVLYDSKRLQNKQEGFTKDQLFDLKEHTPNAKRLTCSNSEYHDRNELWDVMNLE